MYHLKKKAKNKAKFEGSIVEQYVNEEISDFSSYYFESHIQTKSRNDSRNDDGGAASNYPFPNIPEIFLQGGRGSGKSVDVWLDSKDYDRAHSYVLLNCSYLQRFESLFEESMKNTYPTVNTTNKLLELKELYFASWLREHIQLDPNRNIYPIWLHDLVHGPTTKVTSWPMFFFGGYNFHIYNHGKDRNTFNYGICLKGASYCDSSEDADFYGVLTQIFELYYPRVVGLKVVLLRCNWYDSTKKGLRINKSRIVNVNRATKYGKYDPFILASQTDQVCFVAYPHIDKEKGDWYAAIKIEPRGQIISSEELDPALQCENDNIILETDHFIVVDNLADQQEQFANIYDVDDEELDSEAE